MRGIPLEEGAGILVVASGLVSEGLAQYPKLQPMLCGNSGRPSSTSFPPLYFLDDIS